MFKVRHSCQWRRLTWTFFIVLVLYSCKKPLKEEKFQGKPLFKVDYKELEFQPLPLTIEVKGKDSITYFFDYVKKLYVEYNISQSKFISKGESFKSDTTNIYPTKFISSDSIWLHSDYNLFLADMYHIKKVYYFRPLSEKYVVPSFTGFEMNVFDKQRILMALDVECYQSILNEYYEKYVNKANTFAFYKITQDSIILDKMIPLTNEQIFKQSDKIRTVATYPVYFYSPTENTIFFSNLISDTLYKVTLDKGMNIQNIYKKKCSFGYPIEPVYYNEDTVKNTMAASAACAEKQSFVSKLYCDESKKIIYKVVRFKVKEREENNEERLIVQVMDYNLNHIKNIVIPPGYYKWPLYINNTLIFCKIDKKKKIAYYEKMDNKIF
jgi:hypothetical protein